MQQFKEEIGRLLSVHAGLDEAQVFADLEVPPSPELGDFAFPCFKLAKSFRMAPPRIAADLAQKIPPGSFFERVEAKGPYLNFFCNRGLLAALAIRAVLTEKENYGRRESGRGRTVVIDYSSPNIAKPFGIGHLRSTIIGQALYRIFSALGYHCVGINHLGDWGTQFGKMIAAYLRWGEEASLSADPIRHLYDLYVRFHSEAETDQALEDEGRAWFKKLEDGDETARSLWQRFRDLSLLDFRRVYKMLGVEFDAYQGESFYNEMLDDTIRLIEEAGLARLSEGALIVDLEDEGLPPCLLRKQDGATLYATRDLCAAIWRQHTYRFDLALYVVGADQALHFRQLFAVLKKLGYSWAENCHHVPFGLIRFRDGKMSTRQGKLVFLEDVLNRAVELAGAIISEKNPGLSDKETVARQVGTGAIIFGDLYNDRVKDIEFDWDKVLDFSGETAPYIQYSHARICSILRKAGKFDGGDPSLLLLEEEQAVARTLTRFPEAIERAAETYRPSVVARYLVDLAREFNRFYHQCPVLQAQEDVKKARLLLIDAVRQVLVNGLCLLGIAAPEEM